MTSPMPVASTILRTELLVAVGAAGDHPHPGQPQGFGEDGNRNGAYLETNLAVLDHLAGMAQKAETGDVGAGVRADLQHHFGGGLVQSSHGPGHRFDDLFAGQTTLGRCVDDAGADGLGQYELVARPRPAFGQQPSSGAPCRSPKDRTSTPDHPHCARRPAPPRPHATCLCRRGGCPSALRYPVSCWGSRRCSWR